MKTLHFTYEMLFIFSEPVCKHRFTLKCIPVRNVCQEVKEMVLTIEPAFPGQRRRLHDGIYCGQDCERFERQ